MNKLVKGSIAGAAGVALLLGGAGTFAVWNDTVELSDMKIQSGHLQLTKGTVEGWKMKVGDAFVTWLPNDHFIIPGTTLVYTETLQVDAGGKGIEATLSHSDFIDGVSGELQDDVVSTLDWDATGDVTESEDGSFLFVEGTSTITVTITVEFPTEPLGGGEYSAGQYEDIEFKDITFSLTQGV